MKSVGKINTLKIQNKTRENQSDRKYVIRSIFTFYLIFCIVSTTIAQTTKNLQTVSQRQTESAVPVENVPFGETYKQLAGEASEIPAMALPKTAELGISSQAAMIPVSAVGLQNGVQTLKFPVESTEELKLVLLVPGGEGWKMELTLPDSKRSIDLRDGSADSGVTYDKSYIGFGLEKYPAEVFSVNEVRGGKATLKIDTGLRSYTDADKDSPPLGYMVVAAPSSSYGLYSYTNNTELIKGEKIFLNANIYTETETQAALPVQNSVRQLNVSIKSPSGQTTSTVMYDNGLNNDGGANDGLFGGSFIPSQPGQYTLQINATAATLDDEEFIRSSEHVIFVNPQRISVTASSATVSTIDQYRKKILVPVQGATLGQLVNAQAEVWGRNMTNNKMQSVNWISGLVTVERNAAGLLSVPLTLDERWLVQNPSISDGFELRNLRIQDPESYGVIGSRTSSITLPGLIFPLSLTDDFKGKITDEMRMGVRPGQGTNSGSKYDYDLNETVLGSNDLSKVQTPQDSAANLAGGKLLLIHGYCSGDVWKPGFDRGDFSNAVRLNDLNNNRSHDSFARWIKTNAAAYPSYGIVAHSQGGAAALQLYAKYWSGLDNATGNRLIQSVGTPYQGTSLAGMLALLAYIFGVQCGPNFNLTYLGAALWLMTIPTWARKKVYYHTTSFKDVFLRYDYCSLATDLFLRDPDDGVIEKSRGQLPGAYNLGHKTGWCHSLNMRDPGQTTDRTRNLTMSSNAAR